MITFVFWSFAGLSVMSALLCVTRRSPLSSALWLVVTLFGLAGLFVLLDAQFIAAMQVIVYAGAIMVLFLLVIMLLHLSRDQPPDMLGRVGSIVMIGVASLMVLELWVLKSAEPAAELQLPAGTLAREAAQQGVVGAVAIPLFRDFLVPFELTSILLLAAIVGAIVLAKRRI
ncbi:MAG: NADH-quinone oxidoreductase subunit J [Gemmatimonadales bacterium]